MITKRFLPLLCSLLLLSACAQDQQTASVITATVTDKSGKALSNFSIQLIDASNSWTGASYKHRTNKGKNSISLSLAKEKPVVVRFSAPGYQPLYTFIKSVKDEIKMLVQLGSPLKAPNAKPIVIGSFNDFNFRAGKEMEREQNGKWVADIESNADSIRYAIGQFIIGNSITGTMGKLIFNKNSRGTDPAFIRELTKPENEDTYHIEFDPSVYRRIFNSAKSNIQFTNDVPSSVEGVAKVYTLMVKEYLNMVGNRGLAFSKEKKPTEYSYAKFLTKLRELKREYPDNSVAKAADIAKLRLLDSRAFTEDEAKAFLDKMSPDSPLWLMHFTVLTSVVDRAGLENSMDALTDIVNNTPYETLRAEALYNRLRYYHDNKKEAEWYINFNQLVSNHPEHIRTTFAYKRYAPEPSVEKGEPLIHDSFKALEDGKIIKLSEIDESYLLLDFWATWCGPCIASLPNLKETYSKFRNNDFAILSISLDESPKKVMQFRENEMEMPWYHAHEKRGNKKMRELGITGIPHYILLGPERKVITNDQDKLKGDSLSKTLQKYLTF